MLKIYIIIYVIFLIKNVASIINANNNSGKILFGYAPDAISHLRSMMPLINK